MMSSTRITLVVVYLQATLVAVAVNGFVVPRSTQHHTRLPTTDLAFGFFPSSSPTSGDENDEKKKGSASSKKKKTVDGGNSMLEKKNLGLKGLVQLITAGAGAPFLGDFEGVDEETGKFMFSLEANNLVDEDGNSKQTSMPYFESGWVDEDEAASPGFKFPWQK